MTATRDRGAASAVLAIAAALGLLLAVAVLGAAGGVPATLEAACQAQPAPSATATSIPTRYLSAYQQAGRDWGIPWTVLAGIGQAESDQGRSRAPGVHSGTNPSGAAGPMQLGVGGAAGDEWGGAPIHPAAEDTGGYGIDGDHDGVVDVYDPGDAIPSAARFLALNGAATNLRAALFDYNHSTSYVTEVLGWASRYAQGGAQLTAAETSPACAAAALGPLPPGVAGKVIAYARAQLGKPYQFGATGPAAFDCSGLAMMAYRAAGTTIPRTSQQQWAAGPRVPDGHQQPGDLVFFAGADGTLDSPGHVGIVLTGTEMIEAYSTGFPIRISTYGTPSSPPGDQVVAGFTRPAAAEAAG